MLALLLVAFVAISSILTLINWRNGIPLAILIGLVQDPIRKLTPGTPAVLVLASLPVWALVWVGVFGPQMGAWARFSRADRRRAVAIRVFALSLIPGTLVTLGYGVQALPVAALGLFAYVAPILTMVTGYVFPRKSRDIERLLAYWGILEAIVLIGTLLEYGDFMPTWPALGTFALGSTVDWLKYPTTGGVFKLTSGFFRSPDIGAWHAAALVMIALTLSLRRGSPHTRWWLLLGAWGGACLMVAGRRKGIVMPLVWVILVGTAVLRMGRLSTVLRAVGVAVALSAAFYYASGEFGITADYYGNAESTVTAAPQRLLEGSWNAVWETFVQFGAFGGGIGSATQGGQHLGIRVAETWQESGPSKLMVELGLPGLVGAILLLIAVARSVTRASLWSLSHSTLAPLQLGLAAFCAANVVCFTVSHQIYSDLTILNTTAFFLGAALSAADWLPTSEPQVPRPLPVPVSPRRREQAPAGRIEPKRT